MPLIIVSPFKTAEFCSCTAVPPKTSRVCICPSSAATISHGESFFLTVLPTPSRTSIIAEQPLILTDNHETSGSADIASSAAECVSICFFLIPGQTPRRPTASIISSCGTVSQPVTLTVHIRPESAAVIRKKHSAPTASPAWTRFLNSQNGSPLFLTVFIRIPAFLAQRRIFL